MQVSNVNGIGASTVIEADYSYTGSTPPTSPNYFVANRTSGETTTTDFSINSVGQVGIGTAANTLGDLTIQDHYTGDFASSCYSILDNSGRYLSMFLNMGTASSSAGWLAINTKATIPHPFSEISDFAFTISDLDATSAVPPVFQVVGEGTVSIGADNAHG